MILPTAPAIPSLWRCWNFCAERQNAAPARCARAARHGPEYLHWLLLLPSLEVAGAPLKKFEDQRVADAHASGMNPTDSPACMSLGHSCQPIARQLRLASGTSCLYGTYIRRSFLVHRVLASSQKVKRLATSSFYQGCTGVG